MYRYVVFLILVLVPALDSRGLLLLNRPRDISNDCVVSHHLRYDLSFGMGMSDTITVVLRNLKEIDYECAIEIVTSNAKVFLLVVIRFPNSIRTNCALNNDAFIVLKKNKCLRICDLMSHKEAISSYFIISVRGRFRFRFLSNSSINSDMDSNIYQLTATSARKKPKKGCNQRNETICIIRGDEYCFTSGTVCDGIKNCGITDWFDERKSECEKEVERIGYAPVLAVISVLLCVTLAAIHIMMRYLPQSANSFFIFNTNEDNRLCIDPVFTSPNVTLNDTEERQKKDSIMPFSSSSSEELEDEECSKAIAAELKEINIFTSLEITPEVVPNNLDEDKPNKTRKSMMRTMAQSLHRCLRSFTRVASRRRAVTY